MLDSVLGITDSALRLYEASILRPAWDRLSTAAEKAAGTLNWDSAPVGAWNQTDAVAYADMVVKWGIKVARFLQETDPEGVNNGLEMTSLRRGFQFHVAKMVHLQKLGISVPPVPSDVEAVWTGVKAAAAHGLQLGASLAPWVVAGGVGFLALVLWKKF